MTNWNRKPRRPGRRAIWASVVLHVVLLVAAWWGHRLAHSPMEYVAYEMQIVSMADIRPSEEVALQSPEDLVVETPEPVVPQIEPEPPEPDPLPDPVPDPPPPPPDPDPDPEPDPPPPPPDPPAQRQAEPPPTQEEERVEELSSADVAVRMEGLRRDYPAYYRTIVAQIQACHRWARGGSWTTVVRFVIQRNGQIPGASIRLERRSGNAAFDIEAVGAVECAGSGRLGPLPEDLPWDELPIEFTFSPG